MEKRTPALNVRRPRYDTQPFISLNSPLPPALSVSLSRNRPRERTLEINRKRGVDSDTRGYGEEPDVARSRPSPPFIRSGGLCIAILPMIW